MTADVVITSAVRTAIGTFGGSLSQIAPCELATTIAKEAIARSGFDASQIGTTVMGNVIHTEPRDMYLSRVAAIGAGVPKESPSLTLNRICGGGLQAVVSAYEAIVLGNANVALAGGAESMSRAGHLLTTARFGLKMGDTRATDMMIGALTVTFPPKLVPRIW